MDPSSDAATLQRGDEVPHFEVTTLGDEVFRYTPIWQRRNLVLVTLEETGGESGYAEGLFAREADFRALEGVCVVTRDRVTGLPSPGVLVADRWGEIVYVTAASDSGGLPPPSELLEWLDYVARRCPECEGESK
jgi:hypothetical protein